MKASVKFEVMLAIREQKQIRKNKKISNENIQRVGNGYNRIITILSRLLATWILSALTIRCN